MLTSGLINPFRKSYFPVWSLSFSYQLIKNCIDSPMDHYLVTILLTRSKNDPRLEIAFSTKYEYCTFRKVHVSNEIAA